MRLIIFFCITTFLAAQSSTPTRVFLPAAASSDAKSRVFVTNFHSDGSLSSGADVYLSTQGSLKQLTHFADAAPGVTAATISTQGNQAAYIVGSSPQQIRII